MFTCLCENIKHSRVLTTKSLASIHHDTFDPLYSLLSPPHPQLLWWPPLSSLYLCVCFCLVLICSFIPVLFYFRFHTWVKSHSICLSPSDLFHLHPQDPSMLLQIARFHLSYGWILFHCVIIHSSVDGHLGCFYIYIIFRSKVYVRRQIKNRLGITTYRNQCIVWD